MWLKNKIFHFLILLGMSLSIGSCQKPNSQEFIEEKINVQGILVAGQNTQEITIREIETGLNITGAEVLICSSETCYELIMTAPGIYHSAIDLIILPDSTYRLEINYQGKTITSTTQIPSEFSWINVDNTIISIDTMNTGQPVLSAEWGTINDASYVLTLNNLEDNPTPINYPVPTFSFENNFDLPINNTNITLQDLFFTHYGAYRFTVFAVDKSYQDVFFYQPQIQQFQPSEGMDNIQGAFGVFVGVNKLSIDIMVN